MSVFERHFDKKTRQLTAKITFNGLFDHGNNRQQIDNIKYKSKIIFKPIKLDDLIQSQNQENITNVSLLDYAIKKINPIFPNIEQFYGQSSSFERGIVEKFFNMDFMIGNFKTGQYNLDLNNSNINPREFQDLIILIHFNPIQMNANPRSNPIRIIKYWNCHISINGTKDIQER